MLSPIPHPEHQARMFIKGAPGVAVFSAIVTGIAMGKGLFGANQWALIDVVILLGLAYGVYRGGALARRRRARALCAAIARCIARQLYSSASRFFSPEGGMVSRSPRARPR